MLQPRKLKYRKQQKGRSLVRKTETRGTTLSYGEYGLKSLESRFITDRQIDAVTKEMKRILGKRGRLWLRIFPHKPVSKKPPEVRMGGGKGDPDHYSFLVHPGRILVEVNAATKELALQSLKAGQHKLSIVTKVIHN